MSFAATFAVIISLILYSLTQIRIPFLRPVLMLGGIIAISFRQGNRGDVYPDGNK